MTHWAEGYRNPTYLVKDAKVIISFYHEGKLHGLICRVEVACGDCGRVVNEKYGVDKWVRLEDMAVRDGDELGRGLIQIKADVARAMECAQ